MKVGMLTAPFDKESLETVIGFAETSDITCLEVVAHPGSRHVDPVTLTAGKAAKIKEQVAEAGLQISSLAYYCNTCDPNMQKAVLAHVKKTIDAAAMLDVPVVCLLAGMPVAGMSKMETIQKVLPKVFRPILDHADKKGIKIALENYFETCLQGIDTFECLFETIKDGHFGLNYDPSHLYHQECDHLLPVSMFGKRIFHTHAKDTLVDRAKRAKTGIYAGGWWRYVIPGFGNINWGEYISHLRANGYDGVLSIEHEDGTQSREEGFFRGAWYLGQFC